MVQGGEWAQIRAGATVRGFGGDLLQLLSGAGTSVFSFSSGAVDNAAGTYLIALATGHTYTLTAAMKLIPEALPQSSGDLFLQVAGTTQLTGDSTQNIVFPRPPGTVVIPGTVTDSAGIPVANAAVSTSTAEVSGVPMTGFTRSTQTDAMGNYSLTVLSGAN